MTGLKKTMMKRRTTNMKIFKRILRYFLSAIIIGALLFCNFVGGKYIYHKGHYFLESPECVSEETFVFDDQEMNYALVAVKKGTRDRYDLVPNTTCAEFYASQEALSPKTWFDGIMTVIGCLIVMLEIVIVILAVFLYLVSLWIKYIQNPIINWINNGDDAKWRKKEIARMEEIYRKRREESENRED